MITDEGAIRLACAILESARTTYLEDLEWIKKNGKAFVEKYDRVCKYDEYMYASKKVASLTKLQKLKKAQRELLDNYIKVINRYERKPKQPNKATRKFVNDGLDFYRDKLANEQFYQSEWYLILTNKQGVPGNEVIAELKKWVGFTEKDEISL